MIQWHPLFARLLRPVLQDHYDIQTNVPVGDLPREADIILLRRASARKPPFQGLWSHLSRWNILEFKGRSATARVADLDLLAEIGLGIDRRLRETEAAAVDVPRAEVSLWYLANHLGKRFLRDAELVLGGLEAIGAGLWRWHSLQRPLWLVSNRDLPVNQETVPVHLVSDETVTNARAVAELVVTQPEWWTVYGPWLGPLYPNLWKEIKNMASRRGKGDPDWSIVAEEMGIEGMIELWGLKRIIEALGPKKVVEQLDLKKAVEEVGVADFLAQLSSKQRQELKRLLQTKET